MAVAAMVASHCSSIWSPVNADADYGSHDNVDAVLSSEQHADAVRVDEARVRAYGVPFLVIDGSYRISGAQPADVVLQALEQARRSVRR